MNNILLARPCFVLLILLAISEISTGSTGRRPIYYGDGVDATNENGQTRLYMAAGMGLREIMIPFLEQGADVNFRDKTGKTPLHALALMGLPEGAELLLKYGANVNARDNELNTPLHIACVHSYSEGLKKAEIFLSHGADIGARNKYGDTPLHVAFYKAWSDTEQNRKVVEMLLSNGAVVNTWDDDGWGSLAQWVHVYSSGPIERFMEAKHVKLEKGPTINTYILKESLTDKPSMRLMPLHIASLMAVNEQVELLLDNGADVNASSVEMMLTPLHFAAVAGREDVLELLLNHGAMVNARDKDGDTPLGLAIRCNQSKAAAVLRNHGGTE